jgi:ribosome-binding protein aMBF1 (putative translation factor)
LYTVFYYGVQVEGTSRRFSAVPSDLDRVLRAIGRSIAQARSDAGLTQEQLAARTGIDYKRLQRIESGTVNVTIRTLCRIASSLDVPAGSFFG